MLGQLSPDGVQGAVEKVAGPKDLFQALYHHFLCLADKGLQLETASMGLTPTPTHSLTPTPAPSGLRSSVAAGAHGDPEAERVLCIRAMAAVYSRHAGLIGGVLESKCKGWGTKVRVHGWAHGRNA